MTYEEFLAKLKEKNIYAKDSKVSISWVTGGVTGGDCWGGEAVNPIEVDPEPNFDDFDIILNTICPNLSFMQYKTLYRDLVHTSSTGGYGDYYGNFTNKAEKYVELKSMYDKLVEMKLI